MYRALALLFLVVAAGCAAPTAGGTTSSPRPTSAGTPADTATATDARTPTERVGASPTPTPHPAGDPEEDVLGWENGTWYDESIAVDGSDGLNETELDLVVARTMARIEVIRGLEFNESVDVQFRPRSSFTFSPSEEPWRDQYWEMLFVVGEDVSTAAAYTTLYDVVIDGLASEDTIILLVENTTSPTVNRNTLAHELVHAVEHQNEVYPELEAGNRDADDAYLALVEGSAIFFEQRYAERCRTDWSCIALPSREGLDVAPELNRGLYVDFAMPYSAGSRFVERLNARSDGPGLPEARRSPPVSTEQVIHPSRYPEDRPVSVTLPDRSAVGWERLPPPDTPHPTGTVGEARLFTMFWYNAVPPNGTADVNRAQQVDLTYAHPSTTGWAGDAFAPYRNGSQYGYVLKTVWDTEADAREFRAAYVRLLDSHNATRQRQGVYRVPGTDPFADAFRITRRGHTVVIVNAPTVGELEDVHEPRR